MKEIKVLISQRILTRYREDTFHELSKDKELEIFVVFGDHKSEKYKKYSSIKTQPRFNHARLKTLSFIFEKFNTVNQFFFSPGILIHLLRFKPDVVLTEGTSNLLNNLITCNYCLLTRTPYIWWDLGMIRGQDSMNVFRKILYPIIRFYIRKAKIILGYSSFAKKFFLAQGISEQNIVVAGNTIRLDRHIEYQKQNIIGARELKTKLNFQKKFIFITVGGLEKPKRFDHLIETFNQLSSKIKDLALIIVGDGPEEKSLKKLANDSPNIHFSGAQFNDVGLYYMISNVFVLPGLGGLAINEAMVYGLPIISGPADGTEIDLVKNFETGFLIQKNEKNDLYNKMRWFAENKSDAGQMGINAKNFILKKYSLKKMITNIKSSIIIANEKSSN